MGHPTTAFFYIEHSADISRKHDQLKTIFRPFVISITNGMLGMRKQIDLPDDLIKDLKIVAAHADKSVKKYMEDLIVNDVREKAKKLKK